MKQQKITSNDILDDPEWYKQLGPGMIVIIQTHQPNPKTGKNITGGEILEINSKTMKIKHTKYPAVKQILISDCKELSYNETPHSKYNKYMYNPDEYIKKNPTEQGKEYKNYQNLLKKIDEIRH
jgi:hypothetical protein